MRILRPEEVSEFPEFRELSPEELVQAYALAKASFTAADLQRYTEPENGLPLEELIQELEATQKQIDEKKNGD
jgi:hypothetical protein